MMNDEIKAKFSDLVCALSPENLCCDGELPPAQVRAKYNRLQKEWAALEKQVGRKVAENEVWDWVIKKHGQ